MFVIGVGGTTRPRSTSEVAVRTALDAAADSGAEVRMFGAAELMLPLYDPAGGNMTPEAEEFVAASRQADGVIIGSPGYHGTVSGLVKNALDYTEEMVSDDRVYYSGLPIGCIGVAYGWQAAVNTLRTLRDIAHSLRGWPTPYGAAINAASGAIADGRCSDPATTESLQRIGGQVVEFARMRELARSVEATAQR